MIYVKMACLSRKLLIVSWSLHTVLVTAFVTPFVTIFITKFVITFVIFFIVFALDEIELKTFNPNKRLLKQ